MVDASALVAMLFDEPRGKEIARRLEGAALIAPAVLPLEVASACLKKIRRAPQQRGALLTAFQAFREMTIHLAEVDAQAVLRVAEQASLSIYDACYLWLAQEMDSELVTLDERLARASP